MHVSDVPALKGESMAPDWLESLATASIALAFLCAAAILAMLLARPQKMAIMNVVWPVTALYWGPVGVWGLWDMGSPPINPTKRMEQELRQDRRKAEKPKGGQDKKKPSKSFWQQVAVGVTHCGAGCTLGDIIGE